MLDHKLKWDLWTDLHKHWNTTKNALFKRNFYPLMSTTKCSKCFTVLLFKVFSPPASSERERCQKNCTNVQQTAGDYVTNNGNASTEIEQRRRQTTLRVTRDTPLPPHLNCCHLGDDIALLTFVMLWWNALWLCCKLISPQGQIKYLSI